jgi:hypothetical protein
MSGLPRPDTDGKGLRPFTRLCAVMSRSWDELTEAPSAREAPPVIHLPPPADIPPPATTKRRRNSGARKGRHFGPRPVADPRSERIDLRVTPAQRTAIKAAAQEAGLSVAAFICLRTLGRPGPRVHRNPSEFIKAVVRLAAQMGRRGGNLNQSDRAFNQIALAAPEATHRDRLADLLEEGMELYRLAIAEHREACAANLRLMGMRPDDADYY